MRKYLAVTATLFAVLLSLGALGVYAQESHAVDGSGLITGPYDGEAQSLTGAGATFPAVLYTAWFSDYAGITGVQVNYQPIGSGGGIRAVIDQTADFGASDGPMTDAQLEEAHATCGADILHIPTAIGGLAITYNIPDLTAELRFTPDTLFAIFNGDVLKWNDPLLLADNPQLAEVNMDIAVIHRSDGSGTTNIFTTYMSAISERWSQEVGSGNAVRWPTGIGQKGNAGVAAAVGAIPGAIGYVELAYATQNGLSIAFVQNSAGEFLQPNVETVSAAAAGVELPEDLRVMIVNSENPEAYPIAGFTWLLVCPHQTNEGTAIALTRAIWWATHDGQAYNARLDYVPLPLDAIHAAEAQILRIEFNGQPALPEGIAASE